MVCGMACAGLHFYFAFSEFYMHYYYLLEQNRAGLACVGLRKQQNRKGFLLKLIAI